MSRLSLVVLERDERAVLRHLGRAGVVQLARAPAELDTAPLSPRDHRDELVRLDRIFSRIENLRSALTMTAPGEDLSPPEMSLDQAEMALGSLEAESRDLLKYREQLQQRLAGLTAAEEQVSGYRGLDLPLDRPADPGFLHFVTGSLPENNFEGLELGRDAALLPLERRNGRLCLVVLTARRRRAEVDSVLRQAGFQPEKLPAVAGETADGFFENNRREQKQSGEKLQKVEAKLRSLTADFSPALARIETAAKIEQRLLEAEQNFPRTGSATFITGWIPGADAAELERRVREITRGCCIFVFEAAEKVFGEEVPVLLQHPRWLRPFEMLVSAYGLPKYQELEPTLFVAVSFVLMFGMMFGDVGQGAVLAVAGMFALLAGRTKKVCDAGILLLTSGFSSMVFGLVYGSFFGLPLLKRFALWRDPLEGDPMSLMLAAIAAGVVMISLGLALNVINRFRHGDFIGGWLGRFGVAGLVFYWGTLAWLTKLPEIRSLNLLKPAAVLFFVFPVIGWTLKDPLEFLRARRAGQPVDPENGWFTAITGSLVAVFEAVLSFFANTISFVRLAAYTMSHAALLLAAFLMADEVKHVPMAGGLLSVLVIILGNAIAIGLEGVIACVQALRLEYYEFFSKFFSGAGRPFQPFRLQSKTVANPPH